MNIFVIGTIDNRGGAAIVSWELRKKLKSLGHTVSTFVRYKYSNETDVFVIPRKRYQDWLVKLFANDLTFARTKYLLETKEFKEADIVHCHNLHSNFFDLKLLVEMSKRKPVIWTLEDLWAITGFANDSATRKNPNKKRFLLYLWDNTPRLLKIKQKIYSKSKLIIVAVSEWMKKEAQQSILGGQEIVRIYNCVDIDTYRPQDKTILRQELGLPQDKKIVACSIKGWKTSNKIIDNYANNDKMFFMSVGFTHIQTPNKNFLAIPYIKEKTLLSKYLAAADIFLHPTQGDSFGIIAGEALASGTPVVTCNTDALPEVVPHKKVGYVAIPDDVEDLQRGIEYVLNLPKEEYERMSIFGREWVSNNFSLEKMCKEYMALYARVLGEKANQPA